MIIYQDVKYIKKIGEVIVKEETKQEIKQITCGICGKDITQTVTEKKIEQASIFCRNAVRTETGSTGKILELNVCVDCYENKVMPLIETNLKINFSKINY